MEKAGTSSTLPANTNMARQFSFARKYTLLLLFCLAQFIDQSNSAALFSAIPALKRDLGLSSIDAVWVLSAFGLTASSFLLLAGRMSDVMEPKRQFVIGIGGVGVCALGAGFLKTKVPLIVFRALMGCFASLVIPSALALLSIIFPDPHEQARALGLFGACGGLGNLLGLLVGAFFVQWANWRWVFWFVAIVAIAVACACAIVVPSMMRPADGLSFRDRLLQMDLIGVTFLTTALILIIFGVTSGATSGWASAEVIAPLVLGVLLVGVFLWWETRLPFERAVVPPRTWFYPNLSVLLLAALLPFFWFSTSFNTFIPFWQQVYGWSAISTAIHCFPMGIAAFGASATGGLATRIQPKWFISSGILCMIIATALFQYCDKPSAYWPFVFPAFVLGSAGAMLLYVHTNIAIFRAAPASMAGTIGAIFNGALQVGGTVGYAICGSVQTSVEARAPGGFHGFAGRRAAYRVLLGFACFELLAVLLFYRTHRRTSDTEIPDGVSELDKTAREVTTADDEGEKEVGPANVA